MEKMLIAMSGGVDSSVAAWLLIQQGYDCAGAMMRLYDNETIADEQSTCCSLEDVEDARAVARKMGIPFYVFNAKREFEDKVIRDFIRCYECGTTPNPCIQCNRHLKFDYFLHRARILGIDHIATGHYAQIRRDEISGRYLLCKAADLSKDQSYVLYCLTQDQLAHTQFPLGGLSKEYARTIAQKQGFINARKKDSQDICFVPDGDYAGFMERFLGKQYPQGDFLDQQGNVVGKHRGAVCYTLGQRKGLGLAMGTPVYVCGKDMEKNTITVGPNEALFARTLLADNVNWIAFETLRVPMDVMARARYNQKEQPATVYPMEDGGIKVIFHQPQRAMTPGQAIVLYQDDIVLGGGTITTVTKD